MMPRRLATYVVTALLLAACGGGPTIAGTFELVDPDVAYSSSDCSGTGGYSDVQSGLDVVVRDAEGTIIGTSSLTYDAAGSSASRCAYTFSAPVKDAEFYAIEVGDRGALTYSKAEMEDRDWAVSVVLGD